MPGLVSLLDAKHDAFIKELWQDLEIDCGVKGVHTTTLPHFSWQVADEYQWDAMEHILNDLAAYTRPFVVQANGLGLFTADNPVAYIPIVRTKQISEFHKLIWDRLRPISINAIPYYDPSTWIPHITIAYGEINIESLHCLFEKLAFQPIYWKIKIDNLTLIKESDENIGETRLQIKFGGKDSR